jgi:hypothetical protein
VRFDLEAVIADVNNSSTGALTVGAIRNALPVQ